MDGMKSLCEDEITLTLLWTHTESKWMDGFFHGGFTRREKARFRPFIFRD
jgi:hypothetical protein